MQNSALPAQRLAATIGDVFARFDQQDKGNVSFGIRRSGSAYFLKTAGSRDHSRPSSHATRVAMLENAIRLHKTVRHSPLVPLLHTISCPDGPLLVFPWFEGERVGVRREQRDDSRSPFQRFRALPPEVIADCLDGLYGLHHRIAEAGWVAHDLYDGSLMYNFSDGDFGVIDLDAYHLGPSVNATGRMFGSRRFMAPEEFELGARIDQDTNVFTLGRMAMVLLGDGSEQADRFRGSQACFHTALRACRTERDQRFRTVAQFAQAWHRARTHRAPPGSLRPPTP